MVRCRLSQAQIFPALDPDVKIGLFVCLFVCFPDAQAYVFLMVSCIQAKANLIYMANYGSWQGFLLGIHARVGPLQVLLKSIIPQGAKVPPFAPATPPQAAAAAPPPVPQLSQQAAEGGEGDAAGAQQQAAAAGGGGGGPNVAAAEGAAYEAVGALQPTEQQQQAAAALQQLLRGFRASLLGNASMSRLAGVDGGPGSGPPAAAGVAAVAGTQLQPAGAAPGLQGMVGIEQQQQQQGVAEGQEVPEVVMIDMV